MPLPIIGVVFGMVYHTAIAKLIEPVTNVVGQEANKLLPTALEPLDAILRLVMRDVLSKDVYYDVAAKMGLDKDAADRIFEANQFFPSPQDLVSWQGKEVFEPDSIERYGLDAEFENLDLTLFGKAGVDRDQALNFWRAHWQHASFGQVVVMLHRGILTREEVFDWFRLVEIPPFWRDKLMDASFDPFTRVDVRRMWDLGFVTEEELIQAYMDGGYTREKAEKLAAWTKVYVALPDLVAQYRKGWLSPNDLIATLESFGVSAEKAQSIYRQKVQAPFGPERIAPERDLTKAEVVKGVKKELLSFDTGHEFLMRLGYDSFEADFILRVNIDMEGSPETPLEFESFIVSHERMRGKDVKPILASTIEAEKAYLTAKKELAEAVSDSTVPEVLATKRVAVRRLAQNLRAALSADGIRISDALALD